MFVYSQEDDRALNPKYSSRDSLSNILISEWYKVEKENLIRS